MLLWSNAVFRDLQEAQVGRKYQVLSVFAVTNSDHNLFCRHGQQLEAGGPIYGYKPPIS